MSSPEQPHDDGPKSDGKGDADVSFMAVTRHAAHYAIVGIMFPVSIALGFFGGYMIDRRLETVPLFALIGLCLGVAAAIRNLLQTVASDKNV